MAVPRSELVSKYKAPFRSPRNGALPFSGPSDWRFRAWAEVVVVRHFPVRDVVLFPLRGALGEGELRGDDLLEERIARDVFLRDLIVELELTLENRIRSFIELHLVLGLQRDVVLRVAVDRLPLHVLRACFDGTLDNRLKLRRHSLELRLVEADLKLLRVLVIALQHADLGDVGEAERAVR